MDEQNNKDTLNDEQVPVSMPGEVHQPESTPVNDVFVDNPESQPGLPADSQKALDEQKMPKLKKSKKKWLILVFLLLLAGGAAAYYFLGQKKEQAPVAQNNEVEEVETPDLLFYQTGTQFKSYDIKAGNPSDIAKLSDTAKVLYASADGSERIIATFEKDGMASEENKPVNMSVFKEVKDKEAKLVLKTQTFTFDTVASVVLSGDQKSVAYYAFESSIATDYQNDAKIYSAPLDGSNTETALVNGSDGSNHGPLRPALWSEDGKSIYAQAISCYECDGPFTANVWKISTENNTATKIFSQPENTLGGEVVTSPDGKYIAVSADNSNSEGVPETFAELANETFDVYLIDTSNDSSEKIYSEIETTDTEVESNQFIAGWSQDSVSILVGVYVSTADTDATNGSTEKFSRFDFVSISGGKVLPNAVDMTDLNTRLGEVTATIYNDTLFFTTVANNIDNSGYTYSMHSLPIGEGEFEVKNIEKLLPKLKIVGSNFTEPAEE